MCKWSLSLGDGDMLWAMVQCCVSLLKSFLTAASNIWKLDIADAAFFFLKLPELDGKILSHRHVQIKVVSVP